MDSPFLGMVQYFGFNFAPRGYALCNGNMLSIAQNSALFALLGTYYGGNGTTTFGLPDLRGRSIVGQNNSFTMGEQFGTPTATLLTNNMPVHTHTAATLSVGSNTNARGGDGNDPTNTYPSTPSGGSMYASGNSGVFLGAPTVTVGVTGQNQPFNIQNPYIAVTAAIATQGIFPSRN